MFTIAHQIRLVLEAKSEALIYKSADVLSDLIHADFTYVNAGGRVFDKASYIEAYCLSGSIVFSDQIFSGLEVKQVDEFAIATMSIADEFLIDGQIVSGRYKSLCVFSSSSGRWQWAAGQTMRQEPE